MLYNESESMFHKPQDDSVFTKENPLVDTEKPLTNAPIKQRNSVSLNGNLEEIAARQLNPADLSPSMRGVKLPYEIYSKETAKGAEEEAEDEARLLAQTDSYDSSENEPLSNHGTKTVQTPPPLELFYPENYPQQQDQI
jgi:hypothetical protein